MQPAPDARDPLFDFELKIARRADMLSRDTTMQGWNTLELWCAAEQDVGERAFADLVDSAEFRLRC